MNVKGWKLKNDETEKREELRLALVTLNIDLKKLQREPKISEILEHQSLGGIPQILQAMRLSTDPLLMQFLEVFDQMRPRYQEIVPWEAIAQLAETNTQQLLGAIIIALRQHSAMEVKIAALTAHAEITKATVKTALVPGNEGYRDRQLIHQALGFLAPPKGQTINVNMPGAFGDASGELIEPEDIDMNEMFPDLTTTQKLLPD